MSHLLTYARIRNKLLHLLNLERRLRHWDDARYLKVLYRLYMGERLNLVDPQKLNQKLQWLKLNDRRAIYTTLVDKFEAKKWVAEQVGESYVVPNLGLWDSFEEIDFDALPQQFVLKCTHDSGGMVVCEDRSTLDLRAARIKIERSLSRNYYYQGREWPYRNVEPRILAEVYLPEWKPEDSGPHGNSSESIGQGKWSETTPTAHRKGLIDYKFYCFHGEPKFLYVSQGSQKNRTAKVEEFVTLNWAPAKFGLSNYDRFEELPSKPTNFETMVATARQLASGIPFVRVDLFEHLDRVLFSEMTFYPVSGMIPFEPKAADLEIGQFLDLSTVTGTN